MKQNSVASRYRVLVHSEIGKSLLQELSQPRPGFCGRRDVQERFVASRCIRKMLTDIPPGFANKLIFDRTRQSRQVNRSGELFTVLGIETPLTTTRFAVWGEKYSKSLSLADVEVGKVQLVFTRGEGLDLVCGCEKVRVGHDCQRHGCSLARRLKFRDQPVVTRVNHADRLTVRRLNEFNNVARII